MLLILKNKKHYIYSVLGYYVSICGSRGIISEWCALMRAKSSRATGRNSFLQDVAISWYWASLGEGEREEEEEGGWRTVSSSALFIHQ